MFLKDFLSEKRAFTIEECGDKADLINQLIDRVKGSIPNLEREIAIQNLLEKEGVFSTGVGGGIAIPHAVVPGIDKTYLAVAQLKNCIDYKSVDSAPVYIVFMLLSPEGKTHEHIKLLARIARLCFKHDFVEQMKGAGSAGELYNMIIDEDAKHSE